MMEKLEVLIVDQDPALRDVAKDYAQLLLHAEELNIETVSSAEEAFQKLMQSGGNDIDVIVTGGQLPGRSPAEMAEYIRGNKYLNETPIIMCTGDNDFETAKQTAMASGISMVLKQPYTKDQILEAYQEVLPPEAFTAGHPGGADSRHHRPDLVDHLDDDDMEHRPEPL